MRHKRPHIFKFRWWLIFIPILPVGTVGLYATINDWQISSNSLIALLIAIGLSSWLLMMYLSWLPNQGREKSWTTFSEEFHIKYRISKMLLILGILFAWLGIGTLLILLPYWVGKPLNGLGGGLIQFIGICWIAIWLYSIMNGKKKK